MTDPLVSRWEMTEIDRACWRLCDAASRVNDAEGLVAYVERNDLGFYDVLWLRSPCPARSRYRTLAELLADLDDAAGEQPPSGPRSQPPSPIPHLSPR